MLGSLPKDTQGNALQTKALSDENRELAQDKTAITPHSDYFQNISHQQDKEYKSLLHALDKPEFLTKISLKKYRSELLLKQLIEILQAICNLALIEGSFDSKKIEQFNCLKSELAERLPQLEVASADKSIALKFNKNLQNVPSKYRKFRKKVFESGLIKYKPASGGRHLDKGMIEFERNNHSSCLVNLQPDKEGKHKRYQLRQLVGFVGSIIDQITEEEQKLLKENIELNEFHLTPPLDINQLKKAILLTKDILVKLIGNSNQLLNNQLNELEISISKSINLMGQNQVAKTEAGTSANLETNKPLFETTEKAASIQGLDIFANEALTIDDLNDYIDSCNDELPSELSFELAHTIIYILIDNFSDTEAKYYEPLERLCLKFPHLTSFTLNVIEDHELNKNEKAIKVILKILEHAIGKDEGFAMNRFPAYICRLEKIIKCEDEITRLWNSFFRKLLEQVKNENRNAMGIYGSLILDKEMFGHVEFLKNIKREIGAKFALKSLVNSSQPIDPMVKVGLFRKLGVYILDSFDEYNTTSCHNPKSTPINNNDPKANDFLNDDLKKIEAILSAPTKNHYINFTKRIEHTFPSKKFSKLTLIAHVNDSLIKFYNGFKEQENSLNQFLNKETTKNADSKSEYIEHFCQLNWQEEVHYQYRLRSLVLLWQGLSEVVLNVDNKFNPGVYNGFRIYYILNLARAYTTLGYFYEAIECYEELASVNDQESFYLLGHLLFLKAHVKSDSISLCRSIEYLKSGMEYDKDCKTLYKNIMDKLNEKKTKGDYKWLDNTLYEQLKEEYIQSMHSLQDNKKP